MRKKKMKVVCLKGTHTYRIFVVAFFFHFLSSKFLETVMVMVSIFQTLKKRRGKKNECDMREKSDN
jgi:hypothetical protein